ncbi:DJ-1/PfpI family protein [Streptomyces sp. LX-29]|uniref:DJ-1/PfpI family protein n=1 Tax=unclassified Streptomyces TaxID=2593676 RepID=UPI0011865D1E|nr:MULTISPECIES: DJ-1/PfpI family protein [unclassified Streptomyces]TVL89247.1 peptidase [Streptomyces sp. SAJ15]WFB09173.1 DJ-1/PfpI family protein [Streptomyces sp. LX-29]
MAPKILIVTGDAAESLEVLYPYQRLIEEGYEVHIAAPSRKKLSFVVHDFVDDYDTYTEKPGYTWLADLGFSEVDPGQYAALVIPGGRAPEYLRNDPELRKILKAFFDADKPVAQTCHGPLLTAAVGGLAGRRVTAYRALELDMQSAGANYQDAEVVVDGTLVSARAWSDNAAWMRAFVQLLREKAPVDASDTTAAG